MLICTKQWSCKPLVMVQAGTKISFSKDHFQDGIYISCGSGWCQGMTLYIYIYYSKLHNSRFIVAHMYVRVSADPGGSWTHGWPGWVPLHHSELHWRHPCQDGIEMVGRWSHSTTANKHNGLVIQEEDHAAKLSISHFLQWHGVA